MSKVKVRPGWRMMQDGQRPLIGKPDRDGLERPGSYLFHDVKNPGPDFKKNGDPLPKTEFVFEDREEEALDCPSLRRNIRDGFVEVVDKKHETFVLNVDPPDRAAKKSKSKSKTKDED